MNELIVGIDLGTTNSVLAVTRDGQVKVIDIHGQPTMPSCVGIDPAGKLIVGQTAKNQLIAYPDSTIVSIKRKMGEDTKVTLGAQSFSPEEISSFILRELKQEGEKALGLPIRKAVITVPAFFNERQRKATQIAGELAGLEVVRVINEPTAAALAYGAGRAEDETMLVYDLGGGTFDVSVVVVEKGVVEVKASHGDTHLGGDDFDQLLVDFVVAEFKKNQQIDLSLDSKTLRRLKVVLERAKCALSDDPFVRIREEYISGDRHLDMEILRTTYEEMISPLLEKTLHCVQQAMADAKLTPGQIDKVMLVGGSTRTPLVQSLLEDRVQIEPRHEINPDLIVAMGAAIQGAVIAGEKHHSILVDISTHTFSTASLSSESAAWNELICVPIIPRNTPLPASKSGLFHTVMDNQEQVSVEAYQGEAPTPAGNLLIGSFLVTGLSKVPAGNLVQIKFELDLSGMLKVTAIEKATGLSKTVAMDTRAKGSNLDVSEARRNIAALLESTQSRLLIDDDSDLDEEDAQTEETGSESDQSGPAAEAASESEPETIENVQALLATAKDLRKRGELLLAKNISPDDAQEIRTLLHDISQSVANREWPLLKTKSDALADLIFYLED